VATVGLPSGSGQLWISGDTGLYHHVRQVADRLQAGTALLLGGVRFLVCYTVTAKDAVAVCGLFVRTPPSRSITRAGPTCGGDGLPSSANSRPRPETSGAVSGGCPAASASSSQRQHGPSWATQTGSLVEHGVFEDGAGHSTGRVPLHEHGLADKDLARQLQLEHYAHGGVEVLGRTVEDALQGL
jgi:hypothetical protein